MTLATKNIITRYGKMKIFTNDTMIGIYLEKYGEWAQSEIDMISRFVYSGQYVLDIGAYLGSYTMALSQLVGPEGCVYSFEPRPEHFELLKENIETNSICCAKLKNAALSDKIEQVDFPPLDTSQRVNFAGQGLSSNFSTDGNMIFVPVITIDSLNLEKCDFIKLDVEGMEKQVLLGSENTLMRFRPTVYAECLTLQSAWDIIALMQSYHYVTQLHLAPLFNVRNHNGYSEDISNGSLQPMLLFLPSEKSNFFDSKISDIGLTKIETIDDLVIPFITCPNYIDLWALAPRIPSMVKKIDHLKLTYAKGVLDNIHRSFSWKITSPFRWVGNLIRRNE
jgi:FkbM family methyltransferase